MAKATFCGLDDGDRADDGGQDAPSAEWPVDDFPPDVEPQFHPKARQGQTTATATADRPSKLILRPGASGKKPKPPVETVRAQSS